MAHYGAKSLGELSTCHADLQAVGHRVVTTYDHSVLEGRRSWERQGVLYLQGASQLQAGQSRHNAPTEDDTTWLSRAFDIVPYPIDWDDLERFRRFGHFVLGVAYGMGIELVWGGDWDRDWNLRDQRFNDLPHFEMVE